MAKNKGNKNEFNKFETLYVGGFKLLTSSTFSKLQGFTLAIMFTALFGLSGYGLFQYILATITTIAAISNLGIPSIISVNFASFSPKSIPKSLRRIFTISVVTSIFISVILSSLLLLFLKGALPSLIEGLDKSVTASQNFLGLIIFIWSPVYSVNQIFSSALNGSKKFNVLLFSNFLRLFCYGVVLILAKILELSLIYIIILIIIVDLFNLLFQIISSRFLISINRKICSRLVRILKRSKITFNVIIRGAIANVMIVFALWLSQKYLIQSTNGLTKNGYFGIIFRIVSLINFVPIAYSNVLIPYFTNTNQSNGLNVSFKGVYYRMLKAIISGLIIFTLATFIFAEPIETLFGEYGVKLIGDRWIVLLLSSSIILNTLTSNGVLAAKKIIVWINSDYILSTVMILIILSGWNLNGSLRVVLWSYILAYGISSAYTFYHLAIFFRSKGSLASSKQSDLV